MAPRRVRLRWRGKALGARRSAAGQTAAITAYRAGHLLVPCRRRRCRPAAAAAAAATRHSRRRNGHILQARAFALLGAALLLALAPRHVQSGDLEE